MPLRRYNFAPVALDIRRAVLCQYPWPLTQRDIEVGERHERQQGDMAHRWRREYEKRKRNVVPFPKEPHEET